MIFNVKYIAQSGVTAAVVICCLTGCRNGLTGGLPILSESRVKEEQVYSLPEMMLIVATERNRYEQVYTNEIWKVTVDSEGTLFQTYLLEEINGFLEQLSALAMLAEEQEIVLTEQEKESIRQLSRAYYEGLTDGDKAYIRAAEDDIYRLYQDYHLANKVVEKLAQGVNLEISDSEAKVITVMEMTAEDETVMLEAYEKLQAEDADFAVIARDYPASRLTARQIARGELGTAYDEAAFSLEEGQVSGVFRSGDSYYIIKCISAYDEKETQERKQQLSLQRKSELFRQIYERYTTGYRTEYDDTELKSLVFSPEDNTVTTNFFTLYQEHMDY